MNEQSSSVPRNVQDNRANWDVQSATSVDDWKRDGRAVDPLRNVCTSDRGAGGRGGGRFTREGATKAELGPQRHAPGCAEVP